jgi:hypothetical protein
VPKNLSESFDINITSQFSSPRGYGCDEMRTSCLKTAQSLALAQIVAKSSQLLSGSVSGTLSGRTAPAAALWAAAALRRATPALSYTDNITRLNCNAFKMNVGVLQRPRASSATPRASIGTAAAPRPPRLSREVTGLPGSGGRQGLLKPSYAFYNGAALAPSFAAAPLQPGRCEPACMHMHAHATSHAGRVASRANCEITTLTSFLYCFRNLRSPARRGMAARAAASGNSSGRRITQQEFTEKAWQAIVAAPEIATEYQQQASSADCCLC